MVWNGFGAAKCSLLHFRQNCYAKTLASKFGFLLHKLQIAYTTARNNISKLRRPIFVSIPCSMHSQQHHMCCGNNNHYETKIHTLKIGYIQI